MVFAREESCCQGPTCEGHTLSLCFCTHHQRRERAALLSGGRTSPSAMTIGSPLELHQEETRTPQGVHCPAACLPHFTRRHHQSWAFQAHRSRMLHMLACLPLLPGIDTPHAPRHWDTVGRVVGERPIPSGRETPGPHKSPPVVPSTTQPPTGGARASHARVPETALVVR